MSSIKGSDDRIYYNCVEISRLPEKIDAVSMNNVKD